MEPMIYQPKTPRERRMWELKLPGMWDVNPSIEHAYDTGFADGKQSKDRKWQTVAAVTIVAALFAVCAERGHAQAIQAPFRTSQQNSTLYVGQSPYSSIQATVTAACAMPGGGYRVEIQAGISPPDTVAAVTGGCTKAYLADQRTTPAIMYVWNGSQYLPSGGSIQTAPTATQTVLQPSGTALAVNAFNGSVNADLETGASVDVKLAAAFTRAAALGSHIVTINTAGTMQNTINIPFGMAVYQNAALTWAAPPIFGGSNLWGCSGVTSAINMNGTPAYTFLQNGVDNVKIQGCTVNGPSGYMLHVQGSANHIAILDTHTNSMGLLDPSAATAVTDVELGSVSAYYSVLNASNSSGAYLHWTTGAKIHDVTCTNTHHCIQWWGGNAAVGGTPLAGNMAISKIICSNMAGACVWGSMGHDITVTTSQANVVGDVAFDTEGGTNVSFTSNSANGCTNGCGSFFYSQINTNFLGNTFDASVGPAFLGKNSSGNPATQAGVNIAGNAINCTNPCVALQADSATGLHYDNNTSVNAIINLPSFAAAASSISRNHFRFTAALASGARIIQAPIPSGNALLTIEGNDVYSSVAQPVTVVGIYAASGDYNTPDTFFLRTNTLVGVGIGISTSTAGGNAGVATYWTVTGNAITTSGGAQIAHTAPNTNEYYRQGNDNRNIAGTLIAGATVGQNGSVATASTAATLGSQVTATLTWPQTTIGSYVPACYVTATAGVPQIVNLSALTATTMQVTIQNTTAAAASGTVNCIQNPL